MKKLFSRIKNSSKNLLRKSPLLTFIVALAVLLGLIVLANFIRTPEPDAGPVAAEPKVVETYAIGTAPSVQIQGRVEKTGVITIVAQSGGVVRKIAVQPGDEVTKGKTLVSLASNYQGGTVAGVQRQIAQKQYQLSKDT
jgi:multidrug efflux pump subunit AcrA (membrane-fusion protein)